MKTYFIIFIGAAVVLVALLGGVAVRQNSQLVGERARNAEVQNRVASLEQEVTALKETADYYFQRGVDQQSAGNLRDSKAAFEAVVAKFPMSSLVGSAQQRLTAVNEAIAKAEADRAAEMQRQQEEQEKLAQQQGEPIDYSLFYAKAKSTGLPIGKRYRFRAAVSHNLCLSLDRWMSGAPSMEKLLCGAQAAFDDEAQHEQFLQGPDPAAHTIVASMGSDGNIQIHRIE